jgi:hypothetical protein
MNSFLQRSFYDVGETSAGGYDDREAFMLPYRTMDAFGDLVRGITSPDDTILY